MSNLENPVPAELFTVANTLHLFCYYFISVSRIDGIRTCLEDYIEEINVKSDAEKMKYYQISKIIIALYYC